MSEWVWLLWSTKKKKKETFATGNFRPDLRLLILNNYRKLVQFMFRQFKIAQYLGFNFPLKMLWSICFENKPQDDTRVVFKQISADLAQNNEVRVLKHVWGTCFSVCTAHQSHFARTNSSYQSCSGLKISLISASITVISWWNLSPCWSQRFGGKSGECKKCPFSKLALISW